MAVLIRTRPGFTLDINNPPDPLTCRYCQCCDGLVKWNKAPKKQAAHWSRRRRCIKCQSARNRHGFYSHLEYDKYLDSGCYITNCTNDADRIDHDHTVCPQKWHSCEKCRRGPVCAACNGWLQEDVTAETIRQKGDYYRDMSDRALLVAAHLELVNN